MLESEGKRETSRKLDNDIINNREIVGNNLKTYLEKYKRAYFDNPYFWAAAESSDLGTGELAYYKAINKLLNQYFTENKGFLV